METKEFINLLGQSYRIPVGLTGSIDTGSRLIGVSGITTENPEYQVVSRYITDNILDIYEQQKNPIDTSKAAVDQIEQLIHLLENTEEENQLSAVKHLTYAKAFLEKMLLDKINKKTNGHS
jgi:hypothetical protein